MTLTRQRKTTKKLKRDKVYSIRIENYFYKKNPQRIHIMHIMIIEAILV